MDWTDKRLIEELDEVIKQAVEPFEKIRRENNFYEITGTGSDKFWNIKKQNDHFVLTISWYRFGYFLKPDRHIDPDKRECIDNSSVWKPIKKFLKDKKVKLVKDEADSIEYIGSLYKLKTTQLELFDI